MTGKKFIIFLVIVVELSNNLNLPCASIKALPRETRFTGTIAVPMRTSLG
jgi:hypothetical protein